MPPVKRGVGRGPTGASSQAAKVSSGLKLSLPVRLANKAWSDEFAKTQPSMKHVEETIPIFPQLVPVKLRGQNLTLDTGKRILGWKPDTEGSPRGRIIYQDTSVPDKGLAMMCPAYEKRVPLIDPYAWMKKGERPNEPFIWQFQKQDVIAPENKAYVDAVASRLAASVGQEMSSPHMCPFFGAFRGVADTFLYNLEDDIGDMRFTNWFWEGFEKGTIELIVSDIATGRVLTKDEIKEEFQPDDEFLVDDEDELQSDSEEDKDSGSDGSSDESSSSLGAESLDGGDGNGVGDTIDALADALEEASLSSAEEDAPYTTQQQRPATPETVNELSTSSSVSQLSLTEEFRIHAIFHNMPIVMMYLALQTDTMDSLCENSEFAPIKSPEVESIWAAWIFQIIVAINQLQNALNLTHNDLHTCNVLFTKTDVEALWYSDSAGRIWRVPTHGYVFRIIDYGRAIFTCNSFTVIGSDYNDGHDACGMYNFGAIKDDDYPEVYPNKSFDLSRIACSLLRGLFPHNPDSLEKGAILTKENEWIVRETPSQLFNLLWTWLRTRQGTCVLEEQDGEERYPGFDLYEEIAKNVKDAVPKEQFKHPLFKPFLATKIPEGIRPIVIPL
jgi:hypothetical protein